MKALYINWDASLRNGTRSFSPKWTDYLRNSEEQNDAASSTILRDASWSPCEEWSAAAAAMWFSDRRGRENGSDREVEAAARASMEGVDTYLPKPTPPDGRPWVSKSLLHNRSA